MSRHGTWRPFSLVTSFFVAWGLLVTNTAQAQLTADMSTDTAGLTRRGPVSAQVQLLPEKPRIGDMLTLTLTVTAEADVELIMPEFEEGLERFSILSFAPKQSLDDQGRTVATQVYLLNAPLSGQHAIPPLLVEFVDRREGYKSAPEGEDAYELFTERIDFEVESVLPTEAASELQPPLGEITAVEIEQRTVWPWVVGPLLVILVVPLLFKVVVDMRRRARRRSAYDVAIQRLERLLRAPRPEGDDLGPFFVELSGLVRQYLEDRFEVRAPELTTEEFLDVVSQSPDVSAEHQGLLRVFLRQADLVKFAHNVPGGQAVDDSISSARKFLEETRENAPMLEADAVAERLDSPSSQSEPQESRSA